MLFISCLQQPKQLQNSYSILEYRGEPFHQTFAFEINHQSNAPEDPGLVVLISVPLPKDNTPVAAAAMIAEPLRMQLVSKNRD